jgi:hypothetical protein
LLLGLQCGVAQFQLAVVGYELAIPVLEVQDLDDAGQVDALFDQFGDPPQ